MTGDSVRTRALELADAMPVRTVRLTVREGPDRGKSWEGEQATLGTAEDNALTLSDDTVSRYHARISATGEGIHVVDVGSTNGCFLGDARVGDAVLRPGTPLRVGRTSLVVDQGSPQTVELYAEVELSGLLGETQVMRRLMGQLRRAAQRNVAVLLMGESGTGKELLARALHEQSPRASGPFITVDCGAITPSLVASALFGHERGAFTGATQTRPGAFELADAGTLFLDEVGELPLELQAMLLGALERRRFMRVGGQKELSVDVRVVAATHRDLRREVNTGQFRLDLFYRLAVVTLEVPALRDRARDIPLLVERFAREEGLAAPFEQLFSEQKLAELMRHRWPGNVRELKNYVQAAIALGETGQLNAASSSEVAELGAAHFSELLGVPYAAARSQLLQAFERVYLEALMARSQGNVTQAARESQMARSYLNELLRRHGIR